MKIVLLFFWLVLISTPHEFLQGWGWIFFILLFLWQLHDWEIVTMG